MSWTAIYCFTAMTAIFVVSEFLSHKTNGYVSFLVFASILFAAGFWSGILPSDLVAQTGISGITSGLVMPLIVTNLGTTININSMLKEWKTVVISLLGLIGIAVLCCTVGTALFGRVYAYSAVGPIAGGLVAAIMVQEAANAAGAAEIAAFAMVLIAVQNMIGMPIATWCIKHDIKAKIKSGRLKDELETTVGFSIPETKLVPDVPKALDTNQMNFFKVAFVAAIGMIIGTFTPVPAAVAYLILGVVLRNINFLPEAPLGRAGAAGFFMLCMMTMAPSSFAGLTPSKFLEMVVPIIGLMLLGILGIAVFSAAAGKAVKYSPAISFAIGVTALLGYPNTQIITEEAVATLDCSDEEKSMALKYALPKMVVGGFTTVTIASVILASVVVPLIFA
ncbi:MAG: hypothetical protein ACI4F3_03685 [Enterocloster sp.]